MTFTSSAAISNPNFTIDKEFALLLQDTIVETEEIVEYNDSESHDWTDEISGQAQICFESPVTALVSIHLPKLGREVNLVVAIPEFESSVATHELANGEIYEAQIKGIVNSFEVMDSRVFELEILEISLIAEGIELEYDCSVNPSMQANYGSNTTTIEDGFAIVQEFFVDDNQTQEAAEQYQYALGHA